jgi:phosphonate degradation associated HDIG domain protein
MSRSEEAAPKDVQAVLDRIVELFERRGSSLYGGEAVTQTEHALQAAMAAEQEGADSTMISAALLHDLGHLLHNLPETAAEMGIDDRHEELACRWLVRFFGPELTEPIRLHVAAKRYLCATDPEYLAKLSDASKLSLELQGGPFRPEEAEEFERNSHFESAVRLRRWDDVAKVKDLATPDIRYYRRHLEAAAGL